MIDKILKLLGLKPKTHSKQTVQRTANPNPKPTTTPAARPSSRPLPEYLTWREVIFAVTPEKTGVTVGENEEVYGVVMDLALADDKRNFQAIDESLVISLTAFASIESSLRTSFGGGIMGIGEHKDVEEQIKKILPLAQNLLPTLETVEHTDLPKSREVFFYFLTTKGRRFARARMPEIMMPSHPLAELFRSFSAIKATADKLMDQHAPRK